MPYIKQTERESLDAYIDALAHELSNHKDNLDGAVTYAIYRLILMLYPLRFSTLNRAIGLLHNTANTIYWHVLGPYETKKREENGYLEEEPKF